MCLDAKKKMNFSDAFNKYIKGKEIKEEISVPPYGDYAVPVEDRFYGTGVLVKGGYKYLSHGGGCSGEDCNTTFIVSPKNKVIAFNNW
jgi:hypothetical protein